MSYLVMEVHPAYAVVLDQEGRFLKAANLHYQESGWSRSCPSGRPRGGPDAPH